MTAKRAIDFKIFYAFSATSNPRGGAGDSKIQTSKFSPESQQLTSQGGGDKGWQGLGKVRLLLVGIRLQER